MTSRSYTFIKLHLNQTTPSKCSQHSCVYVSVSVCVRVEVLQLQSAKRWDFSGDKLQQVYGDRQIHLFG